MKTDKLTQNNDWRLESRQNPQKGMSALRAASNVAQAFQPAGSGDFRVPGQKLNCQAYECDLFQ
jgi:hypothetical protein